jgi:phosphate-selective porin OprO and OprP
MNFNKKLAVAVSGAVLLMAGQVVLADSSTDIVDALVSKGVLTEEEGKLITKGHTSKTSVTPVVKEKDGSFILESANGRNSIQLTGRMHLDYRNSVLNGNWSDNEVGSYLTNSDRDTATMADQFELRRARLGVKGKFAKDFNYEVVGNLPGTATIDIAYLNWAKYDAANLTIGKFKQPFGLEQLTSSNNIDFMERSYADQLSPGKKIGAMFSSNPRAGYNLAASVYAMNDSELDIQSDKASFAARGNINFAEIMGDKDSIMHVGLAFRDESYSVAPAISNNTSSTISNATRATVFGFRAGGRGLANAFRSQVAGNSLTAGSCTATSTVISANTVTTSTSCTGGFGYGDPAPYTATVKADAFALEAIFARGPFKVQGEFTQARYSGRNNANAADYVGADVNAYYAEALWLITGEKYSDAYKKGAFSSIKPKNDFDLDNGKWGAWEAGLRFEAFDVKDATNSGANSRNQGAVSPQLKDSNTCTDGATSATGCSSNVKTYTAGIKWILNPNVRFMVNYVYTDFKYPFKPIDVVGASTIEKEELLTVRTQYTF